MSTEIANDFIKDRDRLLSEWEASHKQLEFAKEDEMQKRKALVEFICDPDKKFGTETFDLYNGYKLKIVKTQRVNVIQTGVESVIESLKSQGEAGEIFANDLFKWKADVSATEFNKLPEKYAIIASAACTLVDGTPQVKIEEPKKKIAATP